jgi:hypothetical protein
MFRLPAILDIGVGMAQRVVVVDDLDGSEGASTVTFAIQGKPYEIDLNEKNLEKLNKALQPFIDKARPAGSGASQRPGRSRSAGQKIDYTDERHFGQLHRGRITEDEAAMVRGNLEQANKNRAAAGQPAIDPKDAKEKQRYGF